MTVRRRPRAGTGRQAFVWAAIDLLSAAEYQRRLGGDPDPKVVAERRAAVERALTPGELAVVREALSGDVRGSLREFVDFHVGGERPTGDDELEALTVILGRQPRRGG